MVKTYARPALGFYCSEGKRAIIRARSVAFWKINATAVCRRQQGGTPKVESAELAMNGKRVGHLPVPPVR